MLSYREVSTSANKPICRRISPCYQQLLTYFGRMLITQFVFLLPAFTLPIGSSAQIPFSFSNAPAKLQRTGIWALIALLPILSLLTTLYRLPQGSPQPFKPATRVFNAGIWTVHFGIDNEGHDSQQGMARLIRYEMFDDAKVKANK